MDGLGSEALLDLWEQGSSLHPIDRTLAIVARALPDRSRDELARLPLGSRDGLLLRVRAATLGDRLEAHDSCPACGEHVEVELSCAALNGPQPDRAMRSWRIDVDGFRLTLRTIDSVDAAAAARCGDVASAGAALLERAIVRASLRDRELEVSALPDEVVAAAERSLAERDPGAEVMLELRCPACEHRWENVLDVGSFVWTEIADRAQALLLDVDALARVYGWREPDVLALSDERRAAYLALAVS